MSDDTLSMTTANQITQPILAGFRDLSVEIREAIDDLAIAANRPATAPPQPETPTMPPAIAKAVIGVMSAVKKLEKEGNNTFQRYRFTSVDQFYEALGPLMADNGIFDVAFEKSITVDMREAADDQGPVKKSAWLTAEYDFFLYHVEGASYGPIARRIQVSASGAQSYASAQSYAEKYFLRNLFKVPTGDVDEVDGAQQRGLPQQGAPQGRTAPSPGRAADTARKATTRVEQPREPSLSKDSSETLLAKMLATLGACDTRESIVAWSEANHADKERLLELDRGLLVKAFTDKQKEVRKAAKKAEETPSPAEGVSDAHESATA